MEPLRIHFFGGFLLERGERTLPPIPSRAGRSLFAYLVMHKERPHQRDLLAGSFWPELPEARARRRLSHTLWQIQDVLSEGGGSCLAVTADTLAFHPNSPYWLDVEEFEQRFEALGLSGRSSRSLDADQLRTCVELYRGDLLAGFYDDWVVIDQDHYREHHLVALARLVEVTKGQGSYEEALSYARRLTHHDPLREEAHQEVMRLCFLLGRINEALQQFERCRSVLAEELGAEPSEATVEIHRKILRHRRAGTRPATSDLRGVLFDGQEEVPFVGREEERRALVDNMERALGGRGGVVMVEGEPGIGKTRLVMEAMDDARWRGFEVVWGSCSPDTHRPYAPMVALLESLTQLRAEQLTQQVEAVWLGEILQLAPSLARRLPSLPGRTRLHTVEEPTRMREALVRTLCAMGEIAPHLIVVDDVHWADHDTLRVLAGLGPQLAGRVLVLLLFRSEEGRGDPLVWDTLRELDRTAGLGRLVLAPLSVFELGEMVKRSLGLARLEPGLATLMHRATGGNALFALETLHTLRDEGAFDGSFDVGGVLQQRLGNVPVATRVRSVIVARTSILGEEARAVLAAAAVCGEPTDAEILSAAADLPRPTIIDAVDDLLHRRLLADDGEGHYRISHDQVRQVVYEQLDPPTRVEVHRRVAEALEHATPDAVEALAHHSLQGGLTNRAAHFLLEAGRRAVEVNAFETARHHLDEAGRQARAAGWADDLQYRVLGELETVLDVLGRRDEQLAILEEMAHLTGRRPAFKADLDRRRAWFLAHTGRFTEAEEAARRAVNLENRLGDLAGLAAALAALGTCLRWSGRPLEAVPELEAAVRAAAGGPQELAEAHTQLGSTLVEVQRWDEARRHLEVARAMFAETADARGEAEVLGTLARAERQQGHTDDAETLYRQALALCRRIGYRHGEGVNLVNLGNLCYFRGAPAPALGCYEEAAAVFAALGDLRGEAMVLANTSSVRHALLGNDERARAEAERAMSNFRQIGDQARQAQCLEVLAGIEARAGRIEIARELLQESLETLAGTGFRSLEVQHLRSLALLAIDEGDATGAQAALDRAELLSNEAGMEDLAVELLSVRGMARLVDGDREGAFQATLAAVERLSPGVERAHVVVHRHACAARAAGRVGVARQAAAEAHRLLLAALEGLDSDDRRRSLELIPDHRAIVAAWQAEAPRQIVVPLPAAGVPTGRPLRDDERRNVNWTVDAPEDADVDGSERRRRRLLRLVEEAVAQEAVPTLDHLAEVLGVSASTVRRDLAVLRRSGHRLTTRGGRSRVS